MLRGLSTGSKVRVGIIGVGLVGVFGYALAQGQHTIDPDDDEAYARMSDDDDDLFAPRRERGSSLDEYADQQAELGRADIARHDARDALLAGRAQFGAALGDITWHGPIPSLADDSRVSSRLDPLDPTVTIDEAAGTVRADMGAPLTRDEIEVAWGAPDRNDDTWIDAETHTCATLSPSRLAWRRCQSLDDLLGADAPRRFAFEATSAVGSGIAPLRDALEDSDLAEFDERARWHVAGLVEAHEPVEVTAVFDRHGIVTRVEVVIPAFDPEAVHAQLLERMEGHATWTTRGRTVTLQPASADGVMLTISR
ncbi:MAG: hypothetical protein K8W52_45835 [Deltaproteobacteria bacterium]|nr:hypothetical protein [Deltaproteobacteria bacterium]